MVNTGRMIYETVEFLVSGMREDLEAMEQHIVELEEEIEELETHLVYAHDCNRPSVVERVHSRNKICRRAEEEEI